MFVIDCNERPNIAEVKIFTGRLLLEQVRALLTFLRPQSLKNIVSSTISHVVHPLDIR
jgi:hypothetical protein